MTVVVTSVRKEKNFKDCIKVDLSSFSKPDFRLVPLPQSIFHIVTSVRKEDGGSRVIKRGFSIPTHGLADVLVTDSSQTK